jgi:hypothetical protein
MSVRHKSIVRQGKLLALAKFNMFHEDGLFLFTYDLFGTNMSTFVLEDDLKIKFV